MALKDVVTSKYDIVYLSNILECLVCEMIEKSRSLDENLTEREVSSEILKSTESLLKDNGIILLDYRSNSSKDYSWDWLFNNDIFEVSEIPSKVTSGDAFSNNDRDLVLTYKPKQ